MAGVRARPRGARPRGGQGAVAHSVPGQGEERLAQAERRSPSGAPGEGDRAGRSGAPRARGRARGPSRMVGARGERPLHSSPRGGQADDRAPIRAAGGGRGVTVARRGRTLFLMSLATVRNIVIVLAIAALVVV